MGQKQSFLTSQQKPDSPTKSGLLFFSSCQIIYTIIFVLTYYLWLSCRRQCAQTITSLQVPTRVQMRTKSLFSLIREVGGKSARPTLLKAHQNVADHILPLTFTITLCVKENNKSCFLL